MTIWKSIAGWEKTHEVSETGVVRRIGKYLGPFRRGPLRPIRSTGGYYYVCLHDSPRKVKRSVHSLVAETFLCPRPEGMQVNHKDGDKSNNHVKNLEWVTQAENNRHAFRVLHRNRWTKLSPSQVSRIRELSGKKTHKAIAEQFNVSSRTVSLIIRGLRHAGVPRDIAVLGMSGGRNG